MSNLIETIDYFSAGSCTSQLGKLFKGIANKTQTFPAGVFLIKHRKKGYILYDTGYHPDIQKKARYFLYRIATPLQVGEEDRIDQLLKARGIEAEEIAYVILSHLHPDHIGGASYFPNATFILTEEAYQVFKNPRLKDLVFKRFLPKDLENRLRVVQNFQNQQAFLYGSSADLFGDGSIYLSSVGGHARGQACLYFPELHFFIGADLTWGMDLLPYSKDLKLLPSLIQINKQEYHQGIDLLNHLVEDGNHVVVSHDPVERIERVLHALH